MSKQKHIVFEFSFQIQ